MSGIPVLHGLLLYCEEQWQKQIDENRLHLHVRTLQV